MPKSVVIDIQYRDGTRKQVTALGELARKVVSVMEEVPKPVNKPLRFGIVLPSYITNDDRRKWAMASFKSLLNTEMSGIARPLLIAIAKGNSSETILRQFALPKFDVKVVKQPADVYSNDGCLAWGWDRLAEDQTITHMFMLADDWIYNPRWLIELQELIKRHPQAKAWWIYRSAYEEIHKTLKIEGPDVMVRSINGCGCITVEEWRAWHIDYHDVPREHGSLGNISFDLWHPQLRPGERWVTKRSYALNIGLRGECQRPETPDYAVDFVGLGA